MLTAPLSPRPDQQDSNDARAERRSRPKLFAQQAIGSALDDDAESALGLLGGHEVVLDAEAESPSEALDG
jgi:hypothetical protein